MKFLTKQNIVPFIVGVIVTLIVQFGMSKAHAEVYVRANAGVQNNKAPSNANASNVSGQQDYNRFALGYRFKDSPFAVEVGKTNNFTQTFNIGTQQAYTLQTKDVYDVSVLGYVYKGLYAKAGVTNATSAVNAVVAGNPVNRSHSGQSPVFGIGYDYEIWKHADINVEALQMVNVGGNTNTSPFAISAGVKFKY
jgi:hypothetical protein